MRRRHSGRTSSLGRELRQRQRRESARCGARAAGARGRRRGDLDRERDHRLAVERLRSPAPARPDRRRSGSTNCIESVIRGVRIDRQRDDARSAPRPATCFGEAGDLARDRARRDRRRLDACSGGRLDRGASAAGVLRGMRSGMPVPVGVGVRGRERIRRRIATCACAPVAAAAGSDVRATAGGARRGVRRGRRHEAGTWMPSRSAAVRLISISRARSCWPAIRNERYASAYRPARAYARPR